MIFGSKGQPLRYCNQHFVSGSMAELVIDGLKPVKINENQPDSRCVLARHVQRILRLGFEQGAVRKAGEMIVLQRCNVGVHDNGTNSLVRLTRLANRNLKPVMLTIERAGIGRNELPKPAVKNTGYTGTYSPTIRTSTISCSVTFF